MKKPAKTQKLPAQRTAVPICQHICLVGLGLIGSSLARAIKARGLAEHISGFTPSKATQEQVKKLKLVDSLPTNVHAAVRHADIIILCTPVSSFAAISKDIATALKKGAIVTDTGSVKQDAINNIAPHLPQGVSFVPAHPVAGTEKSGPDAGFASLFVNRWCILTPKATAKRTKAVRTIASLWRACGALPTYMTPHHHDMTLALTSHLPHLAAYALVNNARVNEKVRQKEVVQYSAGGFRDFTRIAASDPAMWRDIFLANKDALLAMLTSYEKELTGIKKLIRNNDGPGLITLLSKAVRVREKILMAGQDVTLANFGREKEEKEL